MTTLTSPQYPFDSTGQAASNRITGEIQTLSGGSSVNYTFLVPKCAPFFANSMSLSLKDLQGNIRTLNQGIDYYLSHYFLGASRACAQPIYGSVTILNPQLVGTVLFGPYQTLGGEWTLDSNTIATILADQVNNPRTTTWDQVAGYPDIFPPQPHTWNLQDMVGMSDLVNKLGTVADAIMTQASSDMILHMNDKSDNVHGVTCAMIGAPTMDQLNAAIAGAINGLALNTDDVPEGHTNEYFTQARVLAAVLTGFSSTTATNLAATDTVLTGLMKLQALINSLTATVNQKANMARPQFTGLGSQNLVKIPMNGTISIDITQAESYQLTISANGAIGFNTQNLGNVTGQLIEFSVTTINDNTGNAYAISWPANVQWASGVVPPRTTAAGGKDEWYFWSEDGGVTWIGSLSNKDTR